VCPRLVRPVEPLIFPYRCRAVGVCGNGWGASPCRLYILTPVPIKGYRAVLASVGDLAWRPPSARVVTEGSVATRGVTKKPVDSLK
jgi:hypothetical protein